MAGAQGGLRGAPARLRATAAMACMPEGQRIRVAISRPYASRGGGCGSSCCLARLALAGEFVRFERARAAAPARRLIAAARIRRLSGPEQLARLVRADGVRDQRVLEAIAAVPRAEFVPVGQVERAYRDEPVRIPRGQVTTQPSLIARMLEALALGGGERVLEVGTGHGFQTALLARLVAQVFSVERFADLADTARGNLERQGVRNVELVVGDGSAGLPERAPFDAIVVSAAFPSVPRPLSEQLAEGGRLVQPVGSGGHDDVVLFEHGPKGLERKRSVVPAHFVRLVGAHGFPAE